ncbi:MAG: GNAT family N-acetyltransferase [Chloroflexota bacterium]
MTIQLSGYYPGTIGAITQLHGTYYHQHWDLGLYFEAKVATELSEFLNRFDPAQDGIWIARDSEKFVGAIVIDGKDAGGEGARLRWFIIDPAYHGQGVGNLLVDEAMSFCRRVGFRRVYLTTFAGLSAARHLYEKQGFRLCREEDGSHLTGRAALIEQVFEYVQ